MKSFLLVVLFLSSVTVEARNVKVTIKREPASATQLSGFIEALYGKSKRSCFSGSAQEVCTQVKSYVSRANTDLSQAGAAQRFDVVTCAQNPQRAMVVYSVRSSRENAYLAKKKAKKEQNIVFVERCSHDQPLPPQQIAFSLSN